MLFICGLKIEIMKKMIAPLIIGLIGLGSFYFLYQKEQKDREIHAQLESLRTEIELDISNKDYEVASKKLIKLVHPSSEYSSIEHKMDITSKEFWDDLVKNQSTKYRYDEYWREQREDLLFEINSAKRVDQLQSFISKENRDSLLNEIQTSKSVKKLKNFFSED